MTLRFGFNAYKLTAGQRQALRRFGKALADRRGSLRITGHSDDRGTAFYNDWLSDSRAHSVLDALEESGTSVPPAAVVVIAAAAEQPDVAGSNPAARAKNRRVDLVFTPEGL